MSELDFVRGYVDAACWADLQRDDRDESGCEAYEFGVNDLDADSLEKIIAECEAFVAENESDLNEYMDQVTIVDGDTPAAYAGHDFWLTRKGHGCGFWDRGMGALGDRLSEAARAYGEVEGPWLDADNETVRFN